MPLGEPGAEPRVAPVPSLSLCFLPDFSIRAWTRSCLLQPLPLLLCAGRAGTLPPSFPASPRRSCFPRGRGWRRVRPGLRVHPGLCLCPGLHGGGWRHRIPPGGDTGGDSPAEHVRCPARAAVPCGHRVSPAAGCHPGLCPLSWLSGVFWRRCVCRPRVNSRKVSAFPPRVLLCSNGCSSPLNKNISCGAGPCPCPECAFFSPCRVPCSGLLTKTRACLCCSVDVLIQESTVRQL